MIEIIRQGSKQEKDCPRCGCYFSYEYEDILTESPSLYEGLIGVGKTESYLYCPQCGHKIVVEYKAVKGKK